MAITIKAEARWQRLSSVLRRCKSEAEIDDFKKIFAAASFRKSAATSREPRCAILSRDNLWITFPLVLIVFGICSKTISLKNLSFWPNSARWSHFDMVGGTGSISVAPTVSNSLTF
jgi:hypothetical protein